MTQVLHTPLGQPIFIGDSKTAAQLLQEGVPLHLLSQSESALISGLQARPKTASVSGRKVSADATLQSQQKWAQPRSIPVPKKPDPAKSKEIRKKYTFKPTPKTEQKQPKIQSHTPEPQKSIEKDDVSEPSVPILTSEEQVRTVRIEDILKEAKKKQGNAKAKERYEAEMRELELKKKEERVQKLLSEADTRRKLSRKPETKHALPWGANQRKQIEEQEKIKECAQIRNFRRNARHPLSEDRVGLGQYLDVRKELNPHAVPLRKSRPLGEEKTTVYKQLKQPDLEVETYMKEKRREEKRKAAEEEEKAHEQELERLFRLKELEDLRQRKLSDYKKKHKADPSKLTEQRAKQRRMKQILAKARAKLQQYRPETHPGVEETFSIPSNSSPGFFEEEKTEDLNEETESNHSPSPVVKTDLDSEEEEGEEEEVPVRMERTYEPPEVFVSEANKLGEEKQISFLQQEHKQSLDLATRKAEIRKKLSDLQRRISGHLVPDSPQIPVVLTQYPLEPLVLEQDLPGVKSAEKAFISGMEKPTREITFEIVPGNDKIKEGLRENEAVVRIQTCVRGFLARRRVQRLRVRRSLAEIDPELRKQMMDMDREVLHILENAYTPVTLQRSSTPPSFSSQQAVSAPIPKPDSVAEHLISRLRVKTEEDEYSLLKVIMRSGAFVSEVPETGPLEEEEVQSIREEETPEYSESFCTPSKSSRSESIESSIRDQPFQTTPRPEDFRISPPPFSIPRVFSSIDTPAKELLIPAEKKRTISPGLEDRAKDEGMRKKGKLGVEEERGKEKRAGQGTDEVGSKGLLSGSVLTESISEDLPVSGRIRQDSSISERLSIDDLSKSPGKPLFDASPERPSIKSISEAISSETPGATSGRKKPDSSISEHLSIDDFSKSYGKPVFDLSEKRDFGLSIPESIPEDSGLSKSKEKTAVLTTESVAEMIDSHASQESYRRISPEGRVQRPKDSISESISEAESSSVHRLSSVSDPSKSAEKPGFQPSESIPEEVLESHSSASNVSAAVSSKGGQSSSSVRHKFDSPATVAEEHGIEESISEELSHAQMSVESRKDDKSHKDSDNIKAVEDYSEDFESESMQATLSRRQETKEEDSVSERISENPSEGGNKSLSRSKSEEYSSDFEASVEHKRFDTPEKLIKTNTSIEEEGIEEELSDSHKSAEPSSSEGPQYDDDFESSSPASLHEEDTLHTSSSLPRSTIGGDPEVSGNSESIEWTVDLSPRPSIPAPDIEELTKDKPGKETELKVTTSVNEIVDILMKEALDLLTIPVPKPAVVSPFPSLTLPPLPPLVVKTAKTQLLPTEENLTQELMSLAADLLKQALRNKAVISALSKSSKNATEARTLVDRLSEMNKAQKRPVMSEDFFSLWSAQGDLLESESLSEDLQGKKPQKRVVFDALNELFEKYRKPDTDILPWKQVESRSGLQKFDTEKVRKALEKELGELFQPPQTRPVRESLGGSQRLSQEALQQKRRDELTAKLLELDQKKEIWGQYDTEESVVKLQLAEEILKELATEVSLFLQTGNEIR